MILDLPATIILTDAERRVAELIGRMRKLEDRAAGIVDLRVAEGEIDIPAMGAEIAFARLAGVYPDLSTTPRAGGFDMRLPSGLTVDVKHTIRTDGNLICAAHKHHESDIAVLVVGDIPFRDGRQDPTRPAEFTVVGWAWTRDLMARASLNQSLPRPAYFLDRKRLHRHLPLLLQPQEPSLYTNAPEGPLDLDGLL